MASHMLLPLLIASALAVGFFVLALYRPNPARIIAGGGFILAGLIDAILALIDPRIFVNSLAPNALPLYQTFFFGLQGGALGRFILAIGLWQLVVAGLILVNRTDFTRLGLVAAALFLAGISPLGVGCAFPSNLILAGALIALLRLQWPLESAVPAQKARAKM